MIKLLLFILVHDTIHATGQMFISRGMRLMEDHQFFSIRGILKFLRFCATNGNIWMGLLLNSTGLVLWLLILSFADLSLAFPLDSLQYVIITLFAIIFLKEKVSRLQWLGIGCIVAGLIIVGLK